jgi:putative spermidine/putrescine transport system substrate-binding protein
MELKLHAKRMTTYMVFLICMILLTASCQSANPDTHNGAQLLDASWDKVLEQAKGQTVQFYMWGGSETYNRYIDEWVAPRLLVTTGVTLKRVPVIDTKDVINKLLAEKQAGKTTDGSVDIMWINGENFKFSKAQQLLWGSFAKRLPNVKAYIDIDQPDISSDFGEPTEGLEAPWGKAQFVFTYDSAKVESPPRSMSELKSWVQLHPGKFTYPAPPDFTGSAFVRTAMYEASGGYEAYVNQTDPAILQGKLDPLWKFLNEIEPNLWREGETYPENLAKLEQLYADGEVWMSMSYDPARASNQIANGTFPDTTKTFVLDAGTLSNTHYLSIPFNAEHQAGAMVAINFLLSPDAQITKYDPAYWGEDMVIDVTQLSVEQQQRLNKIDRGKATLSPELLATHRVPEISSALIEVIEKEWLEHVVKK